MQTRSLPSARTLLNAEIIFAEFHYHAHGVPCDRDIWFAAVDAWQNGAQLMPMIEAAIAAAKAIETGIVRRPPVN